MATPTIPLLPRWSAGISSTPFSTGLGGDCFAIYFNAATGAVEGLNGSGRSPIELSEEKLKAEDRNRTGDALHPLSVHSVTVPGAARGWEDTLRRWGSGRKTMQQLLQPTITMAIEGVPIAPLTAESWARSESLLLKQNSLPCVLLPNGRAPAAGQLYRNPELAASFQVLASQGGADEFYSGRIGQSIISCLRERGSHMQLSDLTSHRSTFPTPICVRFKGVDVWEIPPNGQGITALLALNIINEMEKKAEEEEAVAAATMAEKATTRGHHAASTSTPAAAVAGSGSAAAISPPIPSL